jgi:hypothetical protein
MSTGSAQGAYHAVALRYAKALAAQGIRLELLPSSGSLQNLERLNKSEYGEMLHTEQSLRSKSELSAPERNDLRAKLAAIEPDISQMPMPLDFSDKVYTLRQHVAFVRDQIAALPTA